MKRYVLLILAAAIGVGIASSHARAHHAYGLFYDLCTSLTVEGRVESAQWKDPHVLLDLTTDDGTAYRAEWTSLRGLSNRGITADVVKVGDRIAVTGSPLKERALIDPALRGQTDPKRTMVSALTQVRRPSDGWNWTRDAGATPPECVSRP